MDLKKPTFLLAFFLILANGAYAGEKVIDGLVVKRGETKLIENETLVVNGNIVIEPGATLIIRNSDITVNSHYKNQYWVYVEENGTLLVENSVMRDGPVPNLAHAGKFGRIDNFRLGETVIEPKGRGATIILRNSTSEPRIGPWEGSNILLENSYLSILFWRSLPGTKTCIINSSILLLHIWLAGEKEEDAKLSGIYPLKKQNFEINVENGTLHVENSRIYGSAIALWTPYPFNICRKNAIIENSVLTEIFAVFPYGSEVRIRDMRPGFYRKWNIYDVMEASGVPWNLSLRNVYVRKWKLDFHGIAEIENSAFHLDTWDRANVTVRNSKIVSNHHTRGGYVRFINSAISDSEKHLTGVRFLWDPHAKPEWYSPVYVYEFENSRIGPYAELSITDDKIHIFLRGNLSMDITPEKVHWFGGTVTREFNVFVGGNSSVFLIDPEGEKVWEKVTAGWFCFNLTFGKDNYTETFLLYTNVDGQNISKEVGFFTDTPVILSASSRKNFYPAPLFFVLFFILFVFLMGRDIIKGHVPYYAH